MSGSLNDSGASDTKLTRIEDEIRATLRKAIPRLPEEALDHGIHRFRELRQQVLAPLPVQMELPPDLALPPELAAPVQQAVSDNMQAVARLMRQQIVYPLLIELIRLELNLYMQQLEQGS